MKLSRLTAALLTAMLASACGGGHESASVAPNGYGSSATVMIYSQLRSGTPANVGASLCQRLITLHGVVFTNYTRQNGLIVGLNDRSAVSRVENLLRAQPAVLSLSEGPPPTAPPSPGTTQERR